MILQIGYGHFLIESISKPGEWHCVDLEEQGCTCLGHLVHGHCWHLALLGYALRGGTDEDGEVCGRPEARPDNSGA